MPLIELLPPIYVPAFEIFVDRKPLAPALARLVMEVSVTEQRQPPSQFGFRVNDPKLELVGQEKGLFEVGTEIEVHIGYVGRTQPMIVGKISAVTADFPQGGPATLQVDGFDLLQEGRRGGVQRDLPNADSDIVALIAPELEMTASVTPTPPRSRPDTQQRESNLDVLERVARRTGYAFWAEGRTLHFKPTRLPPTPRPIPGAPPAPSPLVLHWGRNLLSFSPRLTSAGQVEAMETRQWDPDTREVLSARVQRSPAAAGELGRRGVAQTRTGSGGRSERVFACVQGLADLGAVEGFTAARMQEQQEGLVNGSGSSAGHPEMHVGTQVKLSGISRFDGLYALDQVTHTVSASGYTTSFQARKT